MEYYDKDVNCIIPKNNIEPEIKLNSHYERLSVREPFYFYVPKVAPSNYAGAVMVANKELIKLGINPDPKIMFKKK